MNKDTFKAIIDEIEHDYDMTDVDGTYIYGVVFVTTSETFVTTIDCVFQKETYVVLRTEGYIRFVPYENVMEIDVPL